MILPDDGNVHLSLYDFQMIMKTGKGTSDRFLNLTDDEMEEILKNDNGILTAEGN